MITREFHKQINNCGRNKVKEQKQKQRQNYKNEEQQESVNNRPEPRTTVHKREDK